MFKKSTGINKTKASFINLVFNYGSACIQIINSIILIPFYLKFMNLSDYGAWIAASAIVNIFMILDPGIATISSQKLSKSFSDDSDSNYQQAFNSSIFLSIIFTTLILIIGLFIIDFIPGLIDYENNKRIDELSFGLNIYIIGVCLVPISSVLSSVLQSLLKTFVDNVANLIAIISSPIVIVLCLLNDFGLVSFALGVLIPNAIRLIGALILVMFYWGKYIQVTIFQLDSINFSLLFKDIKFLYLRKISTNTSQNIETAIAGIFFTTEIAASISIIKRLFLAVEMFSVGIAQATFTSLAHIFAANNPLKLNLALKKTIYSFQLIHLLGSALVLASIGPLIFLWLEKELFFSYFFIILIALNTFLGAKVTLFSSMLYSSGNFREVAYISIIETGIRILLTAILITLLNIYGLPLAGIFAAIVSVYLLTKVIKLKTNQEVVEIIYPSSKYETCIYITAITIGYFNLPASDTYGLVSEIVILSFLIVVFIAFSKQARNLLQGLFVSLNQKEGQSG